MRAGSASLSMACLVAPAGSAGAWLVAPGYRRGRVLRERWRGGGSRIGPGLRKRVLTDAPGARTLAGLASMQHGLSVLPTDTGEPWPVTADANTIR